MSGSTPVFGLKYPVDTDDLADVATLVEQAVRSIEAALIGRVVVPDVTTLQQEIGARAAADTALANRLTALEPTAWGTVPWVGAPYFTHDPGANQPPVQYRKEGKRVFVRGWGTTGTSAVASGSAISSALPAAFRPPERTTSWAMRNAGGVAMRVDIMPDGSILVMEPIAANSYINFATVSWPV